MVSIAIWKHFDDIKAVFWDGTGDIPYDPDQKEIIVAGIEQDRKRTEALK